MRTFVKEIRTALTLTAVLAVILCGAYPLFVFVVGQAVFPVQANGSLLREHGSVIGSELIAQRFAGPAYFHPRPSEAGDGYDAVQSGGSDLGPTSHRLIEKVASRVKQYRAENGLDETANVPADAVTASASGLDPHISVKNALIQARRIAQARGVNEQSLRDRIIEVAEGRTLGILGEPRVNVLNLNRSLDDTK